MGEVVNLRRARKARDRAEAAKLAEANRAKFGRSKAQRETDKASVARVDRTLDGAEIEGWGTGGCRLVPTRTLPRLRRPFPLSSGEGRTAEGGEG